MEIEDRYSAIPIEYRDKVYSLLHGLAYDKPYVIDEKITPENRTAFKVIVAYFIQFGEGDHAGFRIEFNNSYEKIRKLVYFPSPEPEAPLISTENPPAAQIPAHA